MAKTRVLVVDDSVVVRRILSDVINAERGCEVVGTAPNGRVALAKIPQVNPDIVTLDVEMPEMDGLEALGEIRKRYANLPVIMFSTVTERAADATLRALALGATDYVTKPSAGSAVAGGQQIRDQLIPKIRWLCSGEAGRRDFPSSSRLAVAAVARRQSARPAAPRGCCVDVVAIGASTGGPNALSAVIARLADTFPVPIVVTQHMPPYFTRSLAERMNAASAVRVHEAAGGESLEPGHVFVAPGDYHMEVRREGATPRLHLHQGHHENSCRPAVDVMLRSVVKVYGANTLAVVLTGMGQDGLRGCEAVREGGGQIVVQDESSSVVWGMPGSVARAGLADAVLPIGEMASEIMRRVKPSGGAGFATPGPERA